jgi:hypothetical protein
MQNQGFHINFMNRLLHGCRGLYMCLSRPNAGEKIAAVSALLLFILTFLDWFVIEISESAGVDFLLNGTGQSAWEALDYTPVALVIAIAVVLGVMGLRLAGAAHKLPIPASVLIMVAGAVSALLILFRIVDPPSFGSFRGTFGTVSGEGEAQLPIFLALLAAIGITFGGYWMMREEGVSVSRLRVGHH